MVPRFHLLSGRFGLAPCDRVGGGLLAAGCLWSLRLPRRLRCFCSLWRAHRLRLLLHCSRDASPPRQHTLWRTAAHCGPPAGLSSRQQAADWWLEVAGPQYVGVAHTFCPREGAALQTTLCGGAVPWLSPMVETEGSSHQKSLRP